MAWIPKIKATEKQRGQLHVVIEYSDGTTIFNEDQWLSSPATLNDVVFNRIAQLNALDIYALTLTPGASISTIPTPATVLTQAELDRNAWLVNYRKIEKAYRTLVVPGVITTLDPTYSALMTTVKAGIQASYLDYI